MAEDGVHYGDVAAKVAGVKAIMSALVVVISAADPPTPSPTSLATSVSPSFVAGCVAAVATLAFGSALRI
ncbi:hypothetical protein E2542_SST15004 [Spatholobus suberectus]|nr:hypothetical protein E2542_SST15004 [Spatholobus suberectus]